MFHAIIKYISSHASRILRCPTFILTLWALTLLIVFRSSSVYIYIYMLNLIALVSLEGSSGYIKGTTQEVEGPS